MRDLSEVGTLSCYGTTPLSRPLQPGLRLFGHPVPACPSACLATGFPVGGHTGLPCFIRLTGRVRLCFSAGDQIVCENGAKSRSADPIAFWPSAPARFSLVYYDDVCSQFTSVSHTIQALLPPAFVLANLACLTTRHVGYVVLGASYCRIAPSARPSRLLPAERQVRSAVRPPDSQPR